MGVYHPIFSTIFVNNVDSQMLSTIFNGGSMNVKFVAWYKNQIFNT